MSALKTVATAILFRLILKRVLADVQWIAVLLLACGAATSQLQLQSACPVVNGSAPADSDEGMAHSLRALAEGGTGSEVFLGVLLVLVTCFNSGFAGVYSELLLKKDGSMHSIHLQNMMLYAWGLLFNAIAMVLKDHEQLSTLGLFHGYDASVWILVFNNACNGLAISAILKFTNNIVRVYAHTAAMILTMALEVVFMGAPFSPQLCIAIIVVSCSTYLYNSRPPPVRQSHAELLKDVSAGASHSTSFVDTSCARDEGEDLEAVVEEPAVQRANGRAAGKIGVRASVDDADL